MLKHLVFQVLIDNTSRTNLMTEHGFAVWVECDDKVILFDTGQNTLNSDILFKNAKAMDCDLTRIDVLVLSHGHYDHTGTVRQLIKMNPEMKLICHPGVLVEHRYSLVSGQPPKSIAMPQEARQVIRALPADQRNFTRQACSIFSDVGFSGAIPRIHSLEDTGGPFYFDECGMQADPIDDDISLWFITSAGLVILTGCCHSGLMNTIRHIREITGEERIAGIIGGLHLRSATAERLKVTCDELSQWQPEFIIPCHCTGEEATIFLKDKLKAMVVDGGSGLVRQVV